MVSEWTRLLLVAAAVSEAPKEAPAAKKFASYNPNIKTDEEKKEEVCFQSLLSQKERNIE